MTSILFICKTRISYGNSYGLLNSAGFVSAYLNSIGIESKVIHAFDANEVDRLLVEHNPRIVIIEALWITPDKLREIMSLKRHQNRVFIIRIHSRLTFLANEGIAFKWLLGYRELKLRNLVIAPNNNELAQDLRYTYKLQTVYLPNIYFPPKDEINEKDNTDKDLIKIGCFGSVRPMKNHLAQAVAAVKFAKNADKKLEFHINATRMEQQGDQVLHNIQYYFQGLESKYQLIEHDWLSHAEFVQLVRQMDIGMQVSLTETFNIVAADFVYNKVPLIGSPQIEWLPKRFQVTDPNSTTEIVKKLEYAWGIFGTLLRSSSNRSLNKYNSNSKQIWDSYFLL